MADDLRSTQEIGALAADFTDTKDAADKIAGILKLQDEKINGINDALANMGKKYLDTAEGKSFFDKTTQDLKEMRDAQVEARKAQEETDKAIMKMSQPAAESKVSPEEQKEKVFDIAFKALRQKGVAFRGGVLSEDMKVSDDEKGFFEEKAYSTLNLSGAGALQMPATWIRELIDTNVRQTTNIRPYARSFRIPTESMTIPKQTAHGVAYFVSEAGTRSKDTTAAFGVDTYTLHDMYAYFDATIQMLRYSGFPFRELMLADFRSGLSEKQGAKFVNGTGTGEPEGFMVNGDVASINQRHATLILNADALKGVYYNLKSKYRPNSKWIMNSLTGLALSIMKDGAGNYLLPSLQLDTAEWRIMGKEVIYGEDMPDIAANAYPILLADWKNFYTIVEPTGGEVVIDDPYTAKGTGVVEYTLGTSIGGQVSVPEAAKKLKIAV